MRFILLAVIAFLPACTASRDGVEIERCDDSPGTADLKCRADEFEHTLVTSHLDYPLEVGTNVLWCATTQVAWNELCSLVGEDIRMESEDPSVAILNRKDVTRADLDEQTYVAAAGIVSEGILQDIQTRLNDRFAGQVVPERVPAPGSLPPDWFVAYSYLSANLPFEWAFERLEDPLTFGETGVGNFGIRQFLESQENEKKAASQLLIYDYRNENDFIVELKTKLSTHRLFLAKVPPRSTLKATILETQERVAATQPTTLGECSDLRIPVLNFDTIREYAELQAKPMSLKDPRFNDREIGIVLQQIRFRLDERGALLQSESAIVASDEEDLVFDSPFLIMIQYGKGQLPYFALWVDNAELLVPFRFGTGRIGVPPGE